MITSHIIEFFKDRTHEKHMHKDYKNNYVS